MIGRKALRSGIFACTSVVFLTGATCLNSLENRYLVSLMDVIPPASMTYSTLLVTHHRIESFWNRHGKVPAEPTELPDEPHRDCSLTDGWGRELLWESDGTSRVKVSSLGRDGKPGGTGEDADLEIEFEGRQPEQTDDPQIKRSDAPR